MGLKLWICRYLVDRMNGVKVVELMLRSLKKINRACIVNIKVNEHIK